MRAAKTAANAAPERMVEVSVRQIEFDRTSFDVF
jgi:hypothetical protein